MANFESEFSEVQVFVNDYYKSLVVDGTKPIEVVAELFSFEAGYKVSTEEIRADYVRFGYWAPSGEEPRQGWHYNDYDGTGKGQKKVWIHEMDYARVMDALAKKRAELVESTPTGDAR